MADLDELQIKITSSSKDAEEAISRLTRGLNDLSDALGKLDTSKVNSFVSAMTKLANIGNNTNTTARALKSLSNEIANSYGIRTKKGIEDITIALQELYKSARNVNMSSTPENSEVYFKNLQNLQDAIEANYQYKDSVDESTKAIKNYIKAQNQSGQKIAMGDMAKEYGEDFKAVTKVLGKSFNNKLKSTEDALDLAKFFEDMNQSLGTTFKTGNDQELKQSLDDLVGRLQNAKDKVYDFSDAVKTGLLSGDEAANTALSTADRLFALIKEQDKYGASTGLGGLTQVFKEIGNIQMPDMSGVAEAAKNAQKASENVGGAAPKVEEVAKAADTVKESFVKAENEVKVFRDSLDGLGNSKKVIEGARANVGDYTPVERGFISDIQATGKMKMLPAVIAQDMKMLPAVIDKSFEEITRYAYEATKAVENMASEAEKPINLDSFKKLGKTIEDAGDSAEGAKEKIKDLSMSDILSRVMALGEGFEKLSHSFGNIADKGIGIFKKLTSPLKGLVNEYTEKFEKMSNTVKDFQKKFQARMTKLSQFWKRTMKTFTFMLVRKAITAIIEEVGKAIQSLAMYSNAMGTAFNTDISHMVADFQYLGRSIVSVFAPLLNFIVPIIDAIVDRIATLISYIGMLFAALGGSASFTKAKKNVGNYAESLDQASKSAKNLTMGIDELNILSEQSGGGSAKPYDGWEDAWEQVEIPDWINNLADKMKKIFGDLFEPIKKGWNFAKDYVLDGWKFMVENMKQLLSDIWRDFMRVWKSDTVTHIFYNLFMILGDIFRIIGFIAKRFDEAWNEGEKGYIILKQIADIVDILVQHLRNVTLYMVGWASRLNFNPLLESLVHLTASLKDLAEFAGQLFEDLMKRVVLKYLKFLIEEGIPHLQETIAGIIDSFDFGKIRQDLRPLEDAFERLLENLDIGMTNAIGNLGEQIANFANSDEFTAFTQRLADIMDLISAEDVEKILTGIGQGILNLGDALVNFVTSDSFMAFLEDIDEWLANASSEDIAGIIEKIAWAIGLFKFAEFASAGIAGFIQFAGALKAIKDMGDISKSFSTLSHDLGLIGTELGVVGVQGGVAAAGEGAAATGLAALAAPALTIVGIIAAIVVVVYSLIESFGGLDGFIMRIREGFERIKSVLDTVKEAFGFNEAVDNLKDAFSRLGEKLGGLTSLWDMLLRVIEFVVMAIGAVLIPAFTAVASAVTLVIDIVSTLIDVLGGVADIILGVFTFDQDKLTKGWDRILGSVDDFAGTVVDHVKHVFTGGEQEIVEETSKSAKRVAGTYAQDYSTQIKDMESLMSGANTEALTSAVENTDYTTTSDNFAKKTVQFFTGSFQNQDYTGIGSMFSQNVSESLLNEKGVFEDANAETAESGAEKFNTEYMNFFANNKEMTSAMETNGREAIAAFNKGMSEEIANQSGKTVVMNLFKQINETAKTQIQTLKGNLATNISSMISELNFTSSIGTLFNRIGQVINTNIETLGTNLQTTLELFLETYVLPFFSEERWQPLFDNLLNVVFVTAFESFTTWFSESMTAWWEEAVLPWFEASKWDEDIFTPLKENIQEHWDTFSSWWDTTMNEWWENQVKPWFAKDLWKEQLTNILEVTKEVFDLIKEAIKERMNEAAEAVEEACQSMTKSIEDVMGAVDEMLEKLGSFEGFSGDVTFSFGAKEFATGGFPSKGSLFWASETGAGAEMVGTVGGKTGVVSNGEITGIRDAIYSTGGTESQLLAQLIQIGQAMLNKDPIVLSDKDIARMNNSGQNKLGMSIIS